MTRLSTLTTHLIHRLTACIDSRASGRTPRLLSLQKLGIGLLMGWAWLSPTSAAPITYTTPGIYTYTAPANILSVQLTVKGAGGGGGGKDESAAAAGGAGQQVTGTVSLTGGQTLTLIVGGGGGGGRSSVSGTGGGSAGSSDYGSGGAGGNSGNIGTSGAGGGGGGASAVKLSSTIVLLVAGGGGGGGGDVNSSVGTDRVGGQGGTQTSSSGSTSGGAGTSVPTGTDGGGGGGGGGGSTGGPGGNYRRDANTDGTNAQGGMGYANTTYVTNSVLSTGGGGVGGSGATGSTQSTAGGDGSITIVETLLNPANVPNSVWWSYAGQISQGDNTALASWPNTMNAAKNLTASTTAPKFRNNNSQNINFNPVVEFTSTTATTAAAQYFSAPSFLGSSTWNQAHYVFVGYPSSNSQRNWVYFEDTVSPGGAGYSDGRLSVHLPFDGDNIYWDAGNCCSTNRATTSISNYVSTPNIFLLNMDTATAAPNSQKQGIRQNGLTNTQTNAPIAFTGVNTNFYVGYNTVNDNPFRGVMAEGLLFLGNTMTATQASQLESYLAIKYGVTLGNNGAASTSYLSSAGSTIWTAGTGFHNNITGLGRDDTSRLDQRISRSTNSGDQITITTGTSLPDATTTVIGPNTGTAFSANPSYVVIGDNNAATTGSTAITSGTLLGRNRSDRLWRIQISGTAPTQLTVCIPDTMMPSNFLAGDLTDLQLNTASDTALTTSVTSNTLTAGNCPASGVGVTTSVPGRWATLTGLSTGVRYMAISRRWVDHLEITGSSTGLTCQPSTFTVKACANAACSSVFTDGVSGTFNLSGSGLTVNPGSQSFTIASGASTTTVTAQTVSVGTVTASLSGLSRAPTNATTVFCGMSTAATSTGSCNQTVADSGLLISNLNHKYAGQSQTITIQAVKTSDSSQNCAPAFTGAKTLTAKCSYINPTSGTLPLTLASKALNATNSASAACDATGQPISLTFDSTGSTTATLSYKDAGKMQLSLSYSGVTGNTDQSLSLLGSAQFVSAPMTFAIDNLPSTPVKAGSPFSFDIWALRSDGSTSASATPNFGKETSPHTVRLKFVRVAPSSGSAAVDGVFSGTVGAWSGGKATVTDATWDEVGKIYPSAELDLSDYLGSGLDAAGRTWSTWIACTTTPCTLPSGAQAVVLQQSSTSKTIASNQSGSFTCPANTNCYYQITSGRSAIVGGVTVIPHHFDVSATPACGTFTYSGQPLQSVTVTAKNASNATTRNYDGSANTSPNQAKAVTLADATGNASGTFNSTTLALSAFSGGAGSSSALSYTFTNKLTAEQSITLRATNADGVSSSGYTEPSLTLRSGRLMLFNAFGSEKASLKLPLQVQYWNGRNWIINSADTCTSIPTASVVRAKVVDSRGAAATWTNSVTGITLTSGVGWISLGLPSGGSTGSIDYALNLGSTSTDASCLSNHPSSTGAALPWLRSQQGNCASGWSNDPAARASFGVATPESGTVMHVREIF